MQKALSFFAGHRDRGRRGTVVQQALLRARGAGRELNFTPGVAVLPTEVSTVKLGDLLRRKKAEPCVNRHLGVFLEPRKPDGRFEESFLENVRRIDPTSNAAIESTIDQTSQPGAIQLDQIAEFLDENRLVVLDRFGVQRHRRADRFGRGSMFMIVPFDDPAATSPPPEKLVRTTVDSKCSRAVTGGEPRSVDSSSGAAHSA